MDVAASRELVYIRAAKENKGKTYLIATLLCGFSSLESVNSEE